MARCDKCWFADYDPKNPALHAIQMVPDPLGVSRPGAEVPERRVIQTCFKGEFYFRTYDEKEHDCPEFSDFVTEEAKQELKDAEKRSEWSAKTQRTRMSKTTNVLKLLQTVYELNDPAWDIISDVFFIIPEGQYVKFMQDLDDMNIRGGQIPCALEWAGSVEELIKQVGERDPKLVEYVNKKYPASNIEEAVTDGAHRFGHKAPLLLKRKVKP